MSKGGAQTARFCVFSFNCCTVALIGLEMTRAVPAVKPISDALNVYFRAYCDSRERSTVILSHIYLLLGCGFPVIISFILLDGGFFNGEFSTFAFAGIIFLGIGDSVAALGGKKWGGSRWSDFNTKT